MGLEFGPAGEVLLRVHWHLTKGKGRDAAGGASLLTGMLGFNAPSMTVREAVGLAVAQAL